MIVNRQLLWDHDFSEKDYDTEPFKEWYLGRVVTRGDMQDIRKAGGIPEIRKYFAGLRLSLETERLWSWYLGIPGPRAELYGHPDLFSSPFP